MSENEKLQVLRGQVLQPNDPMHRPLPRTPSPPGHEGIINLWGRLRLHATQRGFDRYARMIEAQEAAHLALVNLLKAKEALEVQAVRLEVENLEMLKEHEREKIRHERRQDSEQEMEHKIKMLELEYQLAAAKAKQEGFDHDQEIIRLQRSVDKKNLMDQLKGTSTVTPEEDYEVRYTKLAAKLKKHQEDYAAACTANPNMSQEEKDMWKRQEMEIADEIEKLS